MRIALLTLALSDLLAALAFGVEWLRDRRRPPGRRTFTRPYKLFVVLAATSAMVCFAIAFAIED
jgi:hypothetical protein